MKIIALTSENFKRLTAVEIRPDGNLVQITGRNGAGKSSVLDSLWAALAGKNAIQKKPIRDGQKKARIRLDMGELIVTRQFSATKDGDGFTTSLTVESPDGALFRSPQKVLDELVGSLSFDPLEFARAKPAEQVDMLRTLVPGFDFDQADAQNAADYEKRRDTNRRVKELTAQAAAIDVDPNVKAVDESALIAELEDAGKHNADIETRKANRERAAAEIETLKRAMEAQDARIEDLRKQIAIVEKSKEGTQADLTGLEERLANAEPLPEPIETAAIREKIAAAKTANEGVALMTRKGSLEREIAELEETSEGYSEAIALRNEAKAKAIADAKLPVEGLSFGSGEVELGGVPFDQGSDAEQLRASVAIAAALNPKLRIIRIRDGSLLDEDGMKLVAELAEAQDMQIWLERVDSSGKVGFVIEDGHLAQAEDTEAA